MPIDRLTDDEIGILLTAAVHAPSMHNTQPWRFEVHGPVVDVLLDEERTLQFEDVSGRATHVGLGAAVFNIRVAAAMLGHETRIATHPDPARPEIKARVYLDRREAPVPDLSSLYGEVSQRHTYRGPLLDHPIHLTVRRELDEAACTEGTELHWLEPASVSGLEVLLRQTDAEDLYDEERRQERETWIGGDRSDEGIAERALGPQPVRQSFVRDLSAGFDSPNRSQAVYETAPAIVVLSTPDEDEDAWVRAGQAVQRVLLVATSYKLAASFLDQLLERPAPRSQVRGVIGGRWPQMVLRIGYPAQSNGHTGRRDWRDSFDRWF
ncbi:Acg family FMN-binding oxidoreductase [Kribbella sindirgiensis]|nr:nitroreductase family protein [Kribbella sindirgiensis]